MLSPSFLGSCFLGSWVYGGDLRFPRLSHSGVPTRRSSILSSDYNTCFRSPIINLRSFSFCFLVEVRDFSIRNTIFLNIEETVCFSLPIDVVLPNSNLKHILKTEDLTHSRHPVPKKLFPLNLGLPSRSGRVDFTRHREGRTSYVTTLLKDSKLKY